MKSFRDNPVRNNSVCNNFVIFLLLLHFFGIIAFACDGEADIYILRTDTGFKYILEDTKDSVMSQSSFNERFPQYSNNNKLRFNAQNFNNLSANDKFNIEDLIGYDVKFIRNLIIIE